MTTPLPSREVFFSWPKGRRASLVAYLYEGGSSALRIAKMLGIGSETVYRLLRAAKVPRRKAGRPRIDYTPAFRARVIAAYGDGEGIKAVGLKLGITERQVTEILKDASVELRPAHRPARGPTGPREEARTLRAQGLSLSKIAAALGLNHSQTAWRLIYGRERPKTAPKA